MLWLQLCSYSTAVSCVTQSMLEVEIAKQILCIPPCEAEDGDDRYHLKAFSANSITRRLRNNIVDP